MKSSGQLGRSGKKKTPATRMLGSRYGGRGGSPPLRLDNSRQDLTQVSVM